MTAATQRKVPSNYDQMFPGRFLKAGQLNGKPVTLRVTAVYLEKLPEDNGKMRTRGVLSFAGTDTELPINSTNRQCLEAMFGEDPRALIGKRITFVPEKDRFGSEMVNAIRIAGSPDLDEPITATIKLPRKKPKTRRLVPTQQQGRASAPDLKPADEVPETYDEMTGEVYE